MLAAAQTANSKEKQMYDRSTSEILNRTAERLRHHHAEGRIDVEEFQARLDRCYHATTAGQLQQLVADLPRDEYHAPLPFGRRRLIRWVPILVAILAFAAVTAGHGPHGFLVVFLVFLLARLFLAPRRMWGMRGPRGGARQQAYDR
jgi:hypothetical protein